MSEVLKPWYGNGTVSGFGGPMEPSPARSQDKVPRNVNNVLPVINVKDPVYCKDQDLDRYKKSMLAIGVVTYYESDGSYDGDGQSIGMTKDGRFCVADLGHCSCNDDIENRVFEGDWYSEADFREMGESAVDVVRFPVLRKLALMMLEASRNNDGKIDTNSILFGE